MSTLAAQVTFTPDLTPADHDEAKAAELAALLGDLYGGDTVLTMANKLIQSYDPATKSLSPDHIVYAKARQLILPESWDEAAVRKLYGEFEAANGYKPRVTFWKNLMFSCGSSEKEAATAQALMVDAMKVTAFADSFGGVSPMPDFLIDFILNWEVERYRSSVK